MFGHDCLKPVQSEAVQVLLQGQEVLVTIPTGCGKLLIHQVLPACAALIFQEAKESGSVSSASPIWQMTDSC